MNLYLNNQMDTYLSTTESIINLKLNSSKKDATLYVEEYQEEILYNLFLEEKTLKIKPKYGYMKNQKSINIQMRAILINWLIEVQYKEKFKIETLYQSIWIIDSYLSLKEMEISKFQLLGITALLISCKYNEIYYPKLEEFIQITDNAYKKCELLEMEKEVLKILEFEIASPTSIQFYQIISKIFKFDEKQDYFGKFFLESSLIEYDMISFSPSLIAISSVYIIMKFFKIENYKYLFQINPFIDYEFAQNLIKELARKLCFLVENLSKSNLRSIILKYSSKEFLEVAKYCD